VEVVDSAFKLLDCFLSGGGLLLQLSAHVSLEAQFADQLFSLFDGI